MYFKFTNREEVYIDGLSQEQANQILEESFAVEELDCTDIHDHLWNEDGTRIQHWDEFQKLSRYYEGTYDNEALFACIDQHNTLEDFEKLYLGKYDSGADYARSFVEDCYDVPEFLFHYIDFKALWNEMEEVEVNGYYFRS